MEDEGEGGEYGDLGRFSEDREVGGGAVGGEGEERGEVRGGRGRCEDLLTALIVLTACLYAWMRARHVPEMD